MKHTPGPWAIEWKNGDYNANGTSCIAWVTAPGTNVADVCDAAGMTTEQAEANARLIAAAPELLKALMNCANWAEQLAGDEHHPAMGAVKMAKAAIAKAQGEV